MRPFALVTLVLIELLVAGCHLRFPKVANVTVQQGNVITQDMVDRLKPGMTRRQVAYVMGEPILRDPFNPDRWDYVYSVEVGGVVYQQTRVSLYFEDDALTRFSGDLAPSSATEPSNGTPPPTPAEDRVNPESPG